MEKENTGVFSVELNTETNKYIISYIEDGEKIILDGEEYTFDSNVEANEYVETHEAELNNYITEYKESLNNSDEELTDEENEEELEENEDELEENEDEELEEDKEEPKKDKKGNGWFIKFLSGYLAAVITLVGGHFIAKGISASIKESKDRPSYETTEKGEKPELSLPIVQEKPLTTEEFEKLTTNFTKLYADKNLNVSTEDLVKFVSIVNIDKLVEDNPELASQLFANQAKEEYLNDAAKIIGLTYTYNRNVYQQTGKTDGFIRISDSISGDQKYALETVEAYVDLIATYSYDVELANEYITALIKELGDPTSKLSYLDDGVGFGMQVSIELIRSCIAKDVINKKNLDALTILTSSEEYISNIFTVYDKCNSSYTKTR